MEPTQADSMPAGRLTSLDALRGFDMFWIVGGAEVVGGILRIALHLFPNVLGPFQHGIERQFGHTEWAGFTAWDMIMPLFLFVVGAAMPLSLGKRVERGDSIGKIYAKIIRRTLILFVLGMAAQGNLLDFDLSKLHIYCNTLQAIAAGYFIASVVMLELPVAGQILSAAGLMGAFALLMTLVPVPGYGAGILEPRVNLAMYVDETILGRFRDGTTYTWILSSLTFGATVLLGVFGGHILRSSKSSGLKLMALTGAGIGCLALGWVWSYEFPIIKHIWTSSMVLWAAGWSYLLLAFFYGTIDVLGFKKWAFPFTVIGMNAIAIYMGWHVLHFHAIADDLVGGLAKELGAYGEFLRVCAAFLIAWLILLYMYRKRTFIRV